MLFVRILLLLPASPGRPRAGSAVTLRYQKRLAPSVHAWETPSMGGSRWGTEKRARQGKVPFQPNLSRRSSGAYGKAMAPGGKSKGHFPALLLRDRRRLIVHADHNLPVLRRQAQHH